MEGVREGWCHCKYLYLTVHIYGLYRIPLVILGSTLYTSSWPRHGYSGGGVYLHENIFVNGHSTQLHISREEHTV